MIFSREDLTKSILYDYIFWEYRNIYLKHMQRFVSNELAIE